MVTRRMDFLLTFLGGMILAAVLTPAVCAFASRLHVLDVPSEPRKRHGRAVPLWGGGAIFFAVLIGTVALMVWGRLPGGYLHARELTGIAIALGVLVLGGLLDDKLNFGPWKQFIFPLLAVIIILSFGIKTTYVRNPFGGIWQLGALAVPLTFLWLLGMTYTTKLLDGLDGLATGIGAIGAFMVFALALRPELNQPETALFAILVVGVLLGFLPWNFYPARIFLGEGGSTLIGFLVGVLAIVSGSKVATTLLVIGIPALDVLWIMYRRAVKEKKSIASPDRHHLHFRMLDAGFSHRGAVLTLWALAAAFGGASVFVQTQVKLALLGVLFLIMIILGLWLARRLVKSY